MLNLRDALLRRGWLCLLLLAGAAVLATTTGPVDAQTGHTPGMQMQTAPAAPPEGAGGVPQGATSDTPAAGAHAGHQMPATGRRGVPPITILAGIAAIVLFLLFLFARARHLPSAGVLGGLALLAAVLAITVLVVHLRRPPGQSTVWDATTMDMSTMKPVPGAVPVAIEKAQCGPFTAAVTYTGTVVALNDEDIYPRVTGRVVSVPVYAGDEVRPGQLLARLDDAELSGREREAAAALNAAAQNAQAAREQVSAAEAMRRQKAAAAQAATVGIEEAGRMAQAARAKRTEAERAVTEARHTATAAAREQSMAAARVGSAQSEAEAARSGLDNAAADLDAATADLAYWDAEIKRIKYLRDNGAASTDEYQTEEAKYRSSAAMVKQKQAMVTERKSMLNSALAKVREAQSDAERAAAQTAAAEAAADRMLAGVATANAEADAAATRVDQARANARAAAEEVSSNAAQARAAAAQQRSMGAMAAQSAAALSVARTVRGYTEIRATTPARVLQRVVSPGTVVSPGALLLRLAQVDRVRLQAYVSPADIGAIHVGSRVWAARVDQPGQRVVATVTSISPSADPATRTSVVEALVANPRRQFLPGQAVQMQIETYSTDSAITVPNSAIVPRLVASAAGAAAAPQYAIWTVGVQDSASGVIYTCVMHPEVKEKQPGVCPKCNMNLTPEQTGGKRVAHQVEVTLGPSDGKRTQIVSGFAAGGEVITRGLDNVREGAAVQEVPWGEQGPLQLPAPAGGAQSMPGMPGMSGTSGMSDMPGMDHGSAAGTAATPTPQGAHAGHGM